MNETHLTFLFVFLTYWAYFRCWANSGGVNWAFFRVTPWLEIHSKNRLFMPGRAVSITSTFPRLAHGSQWRMVMSTITVFHTLSWSIRAFQSKANHVNPLLARLASISLLTCIEKGSPFDCGMRLFLMQELTPGCEPHPTCGTTLLRNRAWEGWVLERVPLWVSLGEQRKTRTRVWTLEE